MSGPSPDAGPDTGEERDLLAAEYVLGTLDAAAAASLAVQAREDPDLAAAIAAWEARLSPLARLAPPVEPPPGVWDRLEASAGLRPAEVVRPAARAPAPRRRFWQEAAPWRWATAAGFAVAAVLLVVLLTRPPSGPHGAAALLPTSGTGGFLAETGPGGSLQLSAVRPFAVPQGKDLELWALPPGATQPVSLGVVPHAAQRLAVAHPTVRLTAATQLMVSLEPRGGSPTGKPTGPVLFAGTLED
ncbi:MAG TPA: anti-sigma factor [Acetobacteraceae bacterium]|nr:anti-sigma factor [Acetobacteraceae bacterium]